MIEADGLGSDYLVRNIGPVCPFCGKNWSDNSTCGESTGGWRAQNDAGLLFPGRRGLSKTLKQCKHCNVDFIGRTDQEYCTRSCTDKEYRKRNLATKRASDRKRQATHRAKLRALKEKPVGEASHGLHA